MASFEGFASKVLHLEGGFVNHPADKGGPTKYGVILSTWKQYGYDKDKDGDIDADDIKLLSEGDAKFIAKKVFWDFFQADFILNQSVAEFIVDWGYNSGRVLVAKKLQKLLDVTVDGLIGIQSLKTINVIPQQNLFEALKTTRRNFIDAIVKERPDQSVFYKGWINRINSFRFAD
ncbi:glycoside hydrolase family 108 protein [Ohtaekwangia koreensis]|uniref:Predicted Peptidoglycan domain-containing protein n=1 Tax=Ohtaekwangia koreensis TaxID=688867 RepID=A0A1T5J7F3_9BACT|nr:glycosyl hydrolase 108 family protein [Ohtaekwangia koreensis]SKC47192.1 Predicted Peptidoglycan domain-containing protein [Ohtaekwangia koreensis]